MAQPFVDIREVLSRLNGDPEFPSLPLPAARPTRLVLDMGRTSLTRTLSAIVGALGLVIACSPTAAQPPLVQSDGVARYGSAQLTFDHPSTWRAHDFGSPPSTMSVSLVDLSTEALHQPCVETPNSLRCGYPISSLHPGGVLVMWYRGGSPGWDFSQFAGDAMAAASGQRAVWQRVSPGDCAAIHAEETVTVIFDNHYRFTACAAGPGLGTFEQRLKAMVTSTKFPSG